MKQQRMAVALSHDQDIMGQILVHDIPRLAGIARFTTDAQSLALTQGIKHQTLVSAEPVTVRGADLTRLSRQITAEKFPKRSLADKTDAGAVFLGMGAQAGRRRQLAYLLLMQLTDWKQGCAELRLIEGI